MPRCVQLSCAEDYTAFLDKVRIDGQLCLFKERPGISGPSLGGSPNEWEFSPGTTLPIGPRYPRRGLLLTFIMLVSFTGSITTVTTAIPSWPCFASWFLPRMVKCLRIALWEPPQEPPGYLEWNAIWVCCHFSPRSSHRGVDGVAHTPWPLASRSMAATGVWRTRGCWGRWSEWKVPILRQTMLKAPADEMGVPRYP